MYVEVGFQFDDGRIMSRYLNQHTAKRVLMGERTFLGLEHQMDRKLLLVRPTVQIWIWAHLYGPGIEEKRVIFKGPIEQFQSWPEGPSARPTHTLEWYLGLHRYAYGTIHQIDDKIP